MQRARVRQVLSGAEPMTVDELMQISQTLKLSPGDFGLGDLPGAAAPDAPAELAELTEVTDLTTDETIPFALDPLGNQPKQLFEIGFMLGCDFLFLARANDLVESGVPHNVLERYTHREIPIKLDAAYHGHNNPRYSESSVTLALSFDALYECTFPWTSIRQVVFFPAPPEPVLDVPEEKPKERPARPHLRLVE